MDEPAPPSRADRAKRSGVVGAALALLFVLGIGANLTGILDAPLPWVAAVVAAGLAAAVLHRRLMPPDPSLSLICVVLAVGTGAGLISADATGEDHRATPS